MLANGRANKTPHPPNRVARFVVSVLIVTGSFGSHLPVGNAAAAQEAPWSAQSAATLQKLLGEALKSASSISDPTEKARAYNSIAVVEWRIGSTKDAQRHFDFAHRTLLQIPQNDMVCTIRQGLNEARATVGDLEGAERNLSHCATNASPPDEQDSILSNMAEYEFKSGNLPSALAHIQSISRIETRDAVLTRASYVVARSGHFEGSLDVASQVKEASKRITALCGIAIIFSEHAQPEKAAQALQSALQVAAEIPRLIKNPNDPREKAPLQSNPDMNSYDGIAGTFADIGDFQQAIAVADQYLQGEVRDWGLNYIAVRAAKKGRPDVIRQIDPHPRNPDLSARVTAVLAEAVARSGDQKQAIEIAEKAADLTSQATAFAWIAVAAYDRGAPSSGKTLSEKATLFADAISDRRARSGIFSQLAHAQIKAGDKAAAVRSLSRVSPDDVGWRFLGMLAKEYVNAGDIPGALEVANHLSMGSRAGILASVASEQAKLGDDAGALIWIEPLTSPDEKASALIAVAEGILARNSPDSIDD